jgi:hypothetical protein
MVKAMGPPVSLKPRAQRAAYRTNDNEPDLLRCSNPLALTCTHHGNEIQVPCGRWRTCPGCARRLQWKLRQRFLAGIAQVPTGSLPMFFTLTFPASAAPTEADAHAALRALVRRLRYRGYLGAYGWVLQRTNAGTLHYHGIAHMPWFNDGLAEWRELIQASGFGVQNKLVRAKASHAGYCARYISTRLAELAPLRRAYSFSRTFPPSAWEADRKAKKEQREQFFEAFGEEPDCEWLPSGMVWALLRG